jgi:hypothetical protein
MIGGIEQRKGTGCPGPRGANGVVCITVPSHERVRLTRGVREALGPAWQRLGGENGAAGLGKWAGPGVL